MATPTDLTALGVGQRVQDTFLVLEVDVRSLPNGDPYTVLTLGNSTGRMPTEPFWLERQPEVAGLRAGHAVQVIGEVGLFRDRRQMKIVSVRHLPPEAVDLAKLMPAVAGAHRYWETLDAWRRDIRKPRLRAAVDRFYDDDSFRQRYEQCPAAVRGHHAALGGLLKHTTEVAAIARTIARTTTADAELVLAGALLHDIGKIEAYRWDGLFEFTDRGRLLGHVVLGAMMLEARLQDPPPPCTPLERDLLLHLVLSHHGRLEFGSPVAPMTVEAEILHWADNASAKTATVVETMARDDQFPDGPVSLPQWALERRRLYRGSSDWGGSGEPRPPAGA